MTKERASPSGSRAALWNSAFLKSDDLVQAVAGFLQKSRPQYQDYVVPKARPSNVCNFPRMPCTPMGAF